MSSRRSFLGAAAAALTLPTAAEDPGPAASNPGVASDDPPSSDLESRDTARVAASTEVNTPAGAIKVRPIKYCHEEDGRDEAELHVEAGVVGCGLVLGPAATRQLRDGLRGHTEGFLAGRVEAFDVNGWGQTVEASLEVVGDRLRIEAGPVEAVAVLDDDLRGKLVGRLDEALANPAVVEG